MKATINGMLILYAFMDERGYKVIGNYTEDGQYVYPGTVEIKLTEHVFASQRGIVKSVEERTAVIKGLDVEGNLIVLPNAKIKLIESRKMQD